MNALRRYCRNTSSEAVHLHKAQVHAQAKETGKARPWG